MDEMTLIRVGFGLLYGVIVGFALWDRQQENPALPANKYYPVVSPWLLPGVLGALWLLSFTDIGVSAQRLGLLTLGLLLPAFVFYALLLPLLPVLRRWLTPQSCALLWLLPEWLYLALNGLSPKTPLLVLALDLNFRPLIAIWIAGSLAVLTFRIVQHLRFRRQLLKEARPITDRETLELYRSICAEIQQKEKPRLYRLVRSPAARTPLSIGISGLTVRIVLPEKDYAREEQELIFRHELIHILREDCGAKVFLTLCSALFWFNPLMWAAAERCSQDLELCCDQLVLRDADEDRRQLYGALILSTAGDTRGFTSCLSANAENLRYRLRQVIHPEKRWSGGILVGAIFSALILCSGLVSVGLRQPPLPSYLQNEIQLSFTPRSIVIESASLSEFSESASYEVDLEEFPTIWSQLSKLDLYHLSSEYSHPIQDHEPQLYLYAKGSSLELAFSSRFVQITRVKNVGKSFRIVRELFWLKEPLDIEQLLSRLISKAEQSDP